MRLERPLLALILLVATGLRFVGIAHHVVRGAADFDEQNNFLRPIQRMAREGTLDPTVYQGYPGFFNWIAALPVLAGERLSGYEGAIVAARATVAVFGVVNVWLSYLVARRLSGAWAGLFAAALLAVSRLDVRAAHHVTPDVLGATGILVVLWLLARAPTPGARDAKRDLILGGVTGLATAVKYTGLLAGVPAAVDALLGAGLGWIRRGSRMAAAAAIAFALAAPYAVGALFERGGKLTGLSHYYGEKAERNQRARGGDGGLVLATRGLSGAVGDGGAVLAAAALVLVRPRRAAIPAGAALLASLLILAPAAFIYPRHLVPPGVVLAVLAGAGLGAALQRGRATAAIALILAAVSLPVAARPSVELVARYSAPGAVDLAAEWIEGNVAGPALILSAMPRLALDPERFEVRRADRLHDDAAVAAQFDLLVTDLTADAAAMAGFGVLAQFPSEDGSPDRTITVLAPPADRPTLVQVAPARVERDEAALSLAFATPARVFRVEIDSGAAEWPRDVEVSVQPARSLAAWERAPVAALRPTGKDRRREGAPEGQIFVLAGAEIMALRLEARRPGPWTGAALRILALPPEAPTISAKGLLNPGAPNRRRRRRR